MLLGLLRAGVGSVRGLAFSFAAQRGGFVRF
jgi:hypothetical protein